MGRMRSSLCSYALETTGQRGHDLRAVPTPPALVAAPTAVPVVQGSAGTFGVTLSAAPTSTVTVTVSFTPGNNGLSVTSGRNADLHPSVWNTAQDMTITADSSSTGMPRSPQVRRYARAAINVTQTSATSGNSQGANGRA